MPIPNPPLYRRIAAELRDAIRRGDLAPGQRVPSETELGEQYGVSRMTVRLAVGVLRGEALVVTQQGRGTFVHERPPARLPSTRYTRAARAEGLGPWEATTAAAGMVGSVRVVAVERAPADDEVAAWLEVEPGAEVIVRRRVMYLGNEPVQAYDGHYPTDLFAGTELEGDAFIAGGVYPAMERAGYAPAMLTEQVSARLAAPEEVAALALGPAVPLLVALRVTRDAGGAVLEVLRVRAAADRNLFVYEDLPL